MVSSKTVISFVVNFWPFHLAFGLQEDHWRILKTAEKEAGKKQQLGSPLAQDTKDTSVSVLKIYIHTPEGM